MIAQVTADNEHVIRRMHGAFEMTDHADDVETGDIFIRCMQYHAKQAWMLRSYLQKVGGGKKAAA